MIHIVAIVAAISCAVIIYLTCVIHDAMFNPFKMSHSTKNDAAMAFAFSEATVLVLWVFAFSIYKMSGN